MATFGTVIEVLEVAEDWPEYEEKLGHFFGANGITEEAKKCSILLSVCRAKNYKLIRNLAAPRKPGNIPYDELVKLVGNHYNPKPSVIVQRYMEASGSAMEDMEASGSAMEELDPIETTTQDTNWRWHLAVSQMVLVFIAAVLIAAVSLRQGGSTCQTPCCCKPTVGRQNPRDMKGPRRNSLELGCIVPPGVYAEHYVYPQLIRLSPDR
ncbi:uncharacterized protein [Mobula birostris]|uniref:uncharacterized protein isoform X2 n=1 Tax=Mobula birostris TaxID=1983395 RepID=UPI003B2826F3